MHETMCCPRRLTAETQAEVDRFVQAEKPQFLDRKMEQETAVGGGFSGA